MLLAAPRQPGGPGRRRRQGRSVEVKDAVARVTDPGDWTDVKVEFITANAKLPLTVRTVGGRTIVDGDLDRRIRDCHGSGDRVSVSVRGVGDVGSRCRRSSSARRATCSVDAGGAVFGSVGPLGQPGASGNAGCGDWTVANVTGRMARLSQAGSGDTRDGLGGRARPACRRLGDVAVAPMVRGPLRGRRRRLRQDVHVGIGHPGALDVIGGRLRRRDGSAGRPAGDHDGSRWPARATWTSTASAGSAE